MFFGHPIPGMIKCLTTDVSTGLKPPTSYLLIGICPGKHTALPADAKNGGV